ncbi:MAG TPA: Rrf2 family transcriptional regulator [Myxococcaceae bacterium]|nr:Rrf2 family transcriptional regulator [Myxococcaceae bacterium]
MVLSQTAQYALRALTVLTALGPGATARTRDLAGPARVPNDYLSKIMRKLVEAKLLVSERGHHGGFRLARPPGDITLAEILEAVDEGIDLKECAFGFSRCDARNPCPLHPVYSELSESVKAWAQRSTLADAGPFTRLLARGTRTG